TYNYLLQKPVVNEDIKSRFVSFTKCANNIDCFHDYYEALSYAKEQGKPLLVDFTGYGCVNCRKTEEHIWVNDKIRNSLMKDFVLVSLYVDDREPL
ncbi:thioredoxin family protein, partial [Klebsiella pneumoniae]|uniref:thioredoxin family protein n=1 Tax=Klebsiella pneumoniae TaxID=573 RepID=UPI00200C2263